MGYSRFRITRATLNGHRNELMAMRRRKIHYTVSGDKERCELGRHWWTRRVITDGWSGFMQTEDQKIALRMFRRLKVKWRQIDIRYHNKRRKSHAWLWERMTAEKNRINR